VGDASDVLGAAAPAAIAVAAAEEFGHQAPGREALGQREAVAAMAAVGQIVGPEGGAGPDRDGFLPDAQVGRAVDAPLGEKALDGLLEGADEFHLAQVGDLGAGQDGAPVASSSQGRLYRFRAPLQQKP